MRRNSMYSTQNRRHIFCFPLSGTEEHTRSIKPVNGWWVLGYSPWARYYGSHPIWNIHAFFTEPYEVGSIAFIYTWENWGLGVITCPTNTQPEIVRLEVQPSLRSAPLSCFQIPLPNMRLAWIGFVCRHSIWSFHTIPPYFIIFF